MALKRNAPKSKRRLRKFGASITLHFDVEATSPTAVREAITRYTQVATDAGGFESDDALCGYAKLIPRRDKANNALWVKDKL